MLKNEGVSMQGSLERRDVIHLTVDSNCEEAVF